jgi:Carboxypeptidase regulatory-like domain
MVDFSKMTKHVFTLALILYCSLSVGFAKVQSTGSLKGKIENEKGKPIVGADVRAMRSRDRSLKETKTDEAGNFSFELIPDDYTVSFDADGYKGGTLVQMQQVEDGKETTIKTIRVSKVGHRTSLIRGAVFDSEGASLAGVQLKLVRVPTDEEEKDHKKVKSSSLSYTTNSHGEFAFRVPAERARYRITATLHGYKLETKLVDVSESESVPLSFSLEPVKNK